MTKTAYFLVSLILTSLLMVFMLVSLAVSKEHELRESRTETACYAVGYMPKEYQAYSSCYAAQKEYDTEYLCDQNECWAEAK